MAPADFLSKATLIGKEVLVAIEIMEPGQTLPDDEPTALRATWPVLMKCVAEATQATSTNNGEPNSHFMRLLCHTEVIPRLLTLILDYPPPPLSAVPHDSCEILEHLDAYVWYGALWALSHLASVADADFQEAKKSATIFKRAIPQLVQMLTKTKPWLNSLPERLEDKGPIRRWCLDILTVHIEDCSSNKNKVSSLSDLSAMIALVFALRAPISGQPRHDLLSLVTSTLLLGHSLDDLAFARMDTHTLQLSSPPIGDRIGGISFADLIDQCLDLAREMPSLLKPAHCYLIEMQQIKILSLLIFATMEPKKGARNPALIDAFVSRKLLTYCASLLRDPRADLVTDLPSDERIFPVDFDNWGETVFGRLGALLIGANMIGDSRLAGEFVDSGLLFLLEKWSVNTLEHKLVVIQKTVEFTSASLANGSEKHHLLQLQLAVITHRLLARCDTTKKEQLIDTWTATAKDLPPVVSPDEICSCIGCDCLDGATLRCAACKNQTYCSKACQKSDWKAHKRHCKRGNK